MATTAGALSQQSVGSNTASVVSAAATGGTAPYTYQWYRSTTTGFTPGAGNIIAGATALTLNDAGLTPNSTFYYKMISTDAGSVSATSAQLPVITTPAQLLQNAFAQANLVGIVDMRYAINTWAAMVDVSVVAPAVIYPGQALKLVANNNGGIPKVAPVSSKSDPVIGFCNFDSKSVSFSAGQALEMSLWGNVIWLYATGAITQGAQCCVDPTVPGAVQATGNAATIVGMAIDGSAGFGSLIRVLLTPNPSFATA